MLDSITLLPLMLLWVLFAAIPRDSPTWNAFLQSRCSSSGGRKGFISGFVENIKQELAKNKEMKESIKKFRDEAKKLEESDALREARRKYVSVGLFPAFLPCP